MNKDDFAVGDIVYVSHFYCDYAIIIAVEDSQLILNSLSVHGAYTVHFDKVIKVYSEKKNIKNNNRYENDIQICELKDYKSFLKNAFEFILKTFK